MIAGTYNSGLVVLSVLIAIVASYAAFSLGERVSAYSGQRRWAWLTSGAMAMGFGIWSMHYVGMLAFVLPVPVLYHVPTVIVSLIAAVLGSAAALDIVSRRTMERVDTAVAGVSLGSAVVAMHYIGMAAMRSAAMHHYRLSLVIASVVVAVTFSSLAAWLAFKFAKSHQEFTWTKISSASLMGLGIASMHYTGMAAAYFVPGHTPPLQDTVQVSTLGAVGIAMTTLLLLATVLFTSWYDRRLSSERLLQEAALRSEKDLRDVINTVPAQAWSTLPDGSVDFVNQRWQVFTGLPPQDALGWNWEAVVHSDDRAKFVSDWRAALKSGQPMETEVRVRRADGEYRWVFVRNVPLRDDLGKVVKWYGTGLDIEDRKRAESLLAGEKRILEKVAKGDPLADVLDALCHLAEEQASGVLASILLLEGRRLRHGGAPSLPKAYTDMIDGAEIGPSAGSCGTAAYRGEQVIVEDIASDPLWADYRDLALPHSLRACWSTPVFSSQRKVIATFAMYYHEPRRPSSRDQETIEQITHLAGVAIERKLALDALRRSEAYLAEAQRLTHTGSWARDASAYRVLYWSEETFRILGLDPERDSPNGDYTFGVMDPEDRDRVDDLRKKAMDEKIDFETEYRILLRDGVQKYLHVIGHPVFEETGEVREYVGTVMDITERKRAEEELRAAETRFRTFVDHATDALFVHSDDQGRILDVNRRACESLGYTREELIGMSPFDFDDAAASPAFRQWIRKQLETGEICTFETAHRRKDGTVFPVEVRVRPFWHSGQRFGLSLARDISERKRAEEERERLRRLEADLAHINRVSMMGELTASLAHELNQPISAAITSANACLQWLTRDVPDLERAQAAARRIEKDGTRAAEIIQRLRAFYKKGAPPQVELVDVNEVAREMLPLLSSEANRHSITMRTELAEEPLTTLADRVQLQQVFMNLMLNGIEAMRETFGELTIRSQHNGDGQLLVSVSDTGVGLPREKADQIFNAFYTTKRQGTGMGLAIARSIIEANGGRLWATGNVGPGATFHFTLPAKVGADL